MKLENVVPFGRSYDEYRLMFALSEEDLDKKIISVADAPAAFSVSMKKRGSRVISANPLYIFGIDDIERRFYKALDEVIGQVRDSPGGWIWAMR
ncbi:MAG: hypothetical protein RIG61_07270 [Deltaproteobacteria bacterium]